MHPYFKLLEHKTPRFFVFLSLVIKAILFENSTTIDYMYIMTFVHGEETQIIIVDLINKRCI